jgi:hypothetical protein
MTITTKLNDDHEATLKKIKVLGYITGLEASNKPSQIILALEMLQTIMDKHSKDEFLNLITKS